MTVSTRMRRRNPYATRPGFGFRVANAKRALRRLGADCTINVFTRGFDNCSEMHDGEAVVWALMHAALNGDDQLAAGIKTAGMRLWADWLELYRADAPVDLLVAGSSPSP